MKFTTGESDVIGMVRENVIGNDMISSYHNRIFLYINNAHQSNDNNYYYNIQLLYNLIDFIFLFDFGFNSINRGTKKKCHTFYQVSYIN